MILRIFMIAAILVLIFSQFIPAVCGTTVFSDSSDIDNARIWVKKAVEYEESGMFDSAISAYSSAVRSYPGYGVAWSGLGSVLSRVGRYKEALNAFNQAISLNHRDSEAWYGRGVVFQYQKQYELAKRDIEESLRFSPNNSKASVHLGEIQLSLGDTEGALRSFYNAVSRDPSDGRAFAGLGDALLRTGDLTKAENATSTALVLYPDDVRAWQVMADISYARGKEDWALYYRRTAEDIANYGVTMPEYSKALALQRAFMYNRSLSAFDVAIRAFPDVSIIQVGKGEVLKDLGRYDEALQSYDRAVELSPLDADIRIQRDQVKRMVQGSEIAGICSRE